MRLGLTVGLNHNIPESKCPDPVERQHRTRLWWAIYVFDRMYGSKVGWPIQVSDADIYVEMPSNVPGDIHDDHTSDTEYLVASIELAKITGQVIDQVYSRKKFPESFLHREQKLLISLKEWCGALPPRIRLNRDGLVPKNVISLHLQFNQVGSEPSQGSLPKNRISANQIQCIMLASRPILLHTLIQARSSQSNEEDNCQPNIRQTLKTLSDACIHAARHTHSLIVEEWTNGSLPIFGYFYAHYLFSSALIMVISSLVYPENSNDFALFEAAFEILRAMSSHGNLAATEFYDNLECVKQCLDEMRGLEGGRSQSMSRVAEVSTDLLAIIAPNQLGPCGNTDVPGIPEVTIPTNSANDMAFLGESMEEFLAQPDLDFDLLDPSLTDAVYSWPNLSLWTT